MLYSLGMVAVGREILFSEILQNINIGEIKNPQYHYINSERQSCKERTAYTRQMVSPN